MASNNFMQLNNQDKKIPHNILKVAISNVLTIVSGIFVAFIIPQVMGVTNYGYYKTFTLYIGYIGFFSLGFCDGINLKYAGQYYNELNRKKFRLFFKFYFFTQILFSLMILVFSLFFDAQMFFILLFVAFNLLINNLVGYFQHISQISFRFKELSNRNNIKSIFTIISILVIFLLYVLNVITLLNFKIYLVVYTLINFILCIWYMYTYRDIIFGESECFSNNKFEIIDLYKIGLPLMFANLTGGLLLNLDRQFVSILFETETFAIYAFAYNILSLVTTMISSVSIVLYPSLKKKSEEFLKNNYTNLSTILILVVSLSLIVYFPLTIIIEIFLPNYINSLEIFRIIFPGLIFTTLISVLSFNNFKVLNKTKTYLFFSLISLGLSIMFNIIAYSIFKTAISISIASIIVMVIWYLMVELYLYRRWHFKWLGNILYVTFITLGFYLITLIKLHFLIASIIYLVYCILLSFIFYYNTFKSFIKRRTVYEKSELEEKN